MNDKEYYALNSNSRRLAELTKFVSSLKKAKAQNAGDKKTEAAGTQAKDELPVKKWEIFQGREDAEMLYEKQHE